MIYLDNNATTKLSQDVLDHMLPYLQEDYGNASSTQHHLGRRAHEAIEKARMQVADALHCHPSEIIFTSGATEAINMVLKGIYTRYQPKGKHIITCQSEHKAVLSTCEYLQKKGAEITYLTVDEQGKIDLTALEQAIRSDTILVTLMAANNETGVLFPIQEIANICTKKDVIFFCDATQWVGKQPIDLQTTPIDILCLSAHKFHGPKGIGALYIRRKSKPIQIEPLLIGGKQEHGLRGGTYPTASIVGLGQAIHLATEVMRKNNKQMEELRDYFERQIQETVDEVKINAILGPRLTNTSSILFRHVLSADLMTKLPNIAISSGSACVSGDRFPSHVLKAMHMTDDEALSSLRISLSKYNTKTEIDHAITHIKQAVENIRSKSPVWQMFKAGLLD